MSCLVEELKAMLIARSGNVTGSNGKGLNKIELQKMVRAFLLVETDNSKHTVYFDCQWEMLNNPRYTSASRLGRGG